MNATEQQAAAIHTRDKNLIVVAGAGSGKTRVLVERYLQLLADNPDWSVSALVAITFTRAAAFEMRDRVRQEMERRAQATREEHWARRLANLESARIDTIHGLCADLLRANAAQAAVDPEFDLLDETDAAILLDDVVSDTLAELDAELSLLFAHYDGFKIEAALKQMSLLNAEYPAPGDHGATFATWMADWEARAQIERARLIGSDQVKALGAIDALPGNDKLSDLVAQYRRYLDTIADASTGAEAAIQLMRQCHKDGAVGNKGTAKAWGSNAAKAEAAQTVKDLRTRLAEALDSIGDAPGELDRQAARLLPLWHQLLENIRQTYRERKRAAAQLDFDDLERLAARLLRDENVRVRYRGAEFKHLLVDEFQDTNTAQWQIIDSLADMRTGGSLFAVGDPKQSIYQFRGADVSVFNRVAQDFRANPAGLYLPLSVTFRSHRNLVAQFNALFERLMTRDDCSPSKDFEVTFDEPMRAFRAESPATPAIQLQLLDNEIRDQAGNPAASKRERRQRYSADDMRRWEANEIAMRILDAVESERQVYDKDSGQWRAIDFGDIAILFQSMANVTLYEDAFKSRELPFLTLAGRGYYDRQEVWDMLELLRFLHNPADDLALATVLRSPMFAFSDDLLFALRLIPAADDGASPPLPLWQALNLSAQTPAPGVEDADLPLLLHARVTLSNLRQISGRVTISELLRRALARTNYLAVLTSLPDGDRRRGNIEKLLHLAETSGKITLGKFSQYLSDLATREVREGEAHLEAGKAIRLMTVHASKGLEFPWVILADASWERGTQGAPTLLVNPEAGLSCQVYDAETNAYFDGFAHRRTAAIQSRKAAAERKRLLYVAATRAQDYLLVSGQVSHKKDQGWASKGWLQQLIDVLKLEDLELRPEQTRDLGGRPLSIVMPQAPPPTAATRRLVNAPADLWDFEASERDFPPCAPPLIKPLRLRDSPGLKHITASQIAEIGEYRLGLGDEERLNAASRFRQNALPAWRPADTPVIVGGIVHELLRHGNVSALKPITDRQLGAVAWEHGVTNPAALRHVSRDVKAMLSLHLSSDVYRWVSEARRDCRPLFTELPFMFRADKRVIHGVIDAVLQQPDGAWTIIDYKSSVVADGAYEEHAKRFRLQLGVYAAALSRKLSLDRLPRIFVHYLRGPRTLELAAADCLAELERLEATIDELVANDV